MSKVIYFIILLISEILAIKPGFVKETIFGVCKNNAISGKSNDVQSINYYNGFGQTVQTHLTQDINNDLVRSVFFDAAGRTQFTTNLYIDNTNQVFVKDNFEKINTDKLKNLYNDQRAFTEIEYYKDPLNRISCIRGPGDEFVNHWVYYWYFSVNRINSAEVVTVNGTKGSVAFKNGFIISCTPIANSGFKEKDVLDEISTKMLESNPYVTKELALVVTMDSDDHINQKLINSFGNVVATRSDPSQISTTDAIISNYQYDIFGNISLAEAPKKGTEGNSSAEKIIDDTHFSYNSLGQLVETKTPDGPLYRYEYNDIGEMAFARAYDINNNCIRELSYNYDNLQRLTIVYQIIKDKNGNSIKVLRIQNIYDDLDLLNGIKIPADYLNKIKTLLKNTRGRQIASLCFSDGNRTVGDFYSYDDEGRVDQKVKMIPGVPLQIIKCTYDLQSKLILENIDCGNKSINKKYDYDKLGRIKSIKHEDNQKDLVDYSYDNLGRMNKKTFGIKTGMSMNYDYSVRNWLTSISNSDLTGFNEIISYSGIYNGNIKSTEYKYNINGTPNVFKQTYNYDQCNRLINVTSVNTDYSANYSYNEVGQFQLKKEGNNSNINNYSYYPMTNRLRKAKDNSKDFYIYDSFGNIVIDLHKNMIIEYDWRDLPINFYFYDNISQLIGQSILIQTDGTYKLSTSTSYANIYEYLRQCPGINLLSSVYMLYDASGNRVIKSSNN